MLSRRVMIAGKVQGVGFRAWVQDNAREHGLLGWVRNRYDGTVEAFFQGDDMAVEGMLDACIDGPLYAVVSGVEVFPETVDLALRQFIIRPNLGDEG